MRKQNLQRNGLKYRLLSCVALAAMAGNTMAPIAMAAESDDAATLTPIKHVIIIIGENRTFDHIFATYKPVNKGEKVLNLLSRRIVQANGAAGRQLWRGLAVPSVRHQALSADACQEPRIASCRPPWLAARRRLMCALALGVTTGTSCVKPANASAAAKAIENGLRRRLLSISSDRGHRPDEQDARHAHLLRRPAMRRIFRPGPIS